MVAPLEHKAVLGSARGCAEGLFAGPWGGLTPGRISKRQVPDLQCCTHCRGAGRDEVQTP